jgi:hypothetical protein
MTVGMTANAATTVGTRASATNMAGGTRVDRIARYPKG